jgi:hypothetical protein
LAASCSSLRAHACWRWAVTTRISCPRPWPLSGGARWRWIPCGARASRC